MAVKFRSQFSNVKHSTEHNSGVRHPEFNDNVRTSVAEFIEAFAQGTPLQRYVRRVEFDKNPDIDDKIDSIFDNPLGDKDIIDLDNEITRLQQDATTTNDDASLAK